MAMRSGSRHSVIIVAGGKGLRMGGDLPKQFVPICGKPLLMHTLETFYRWDPGISQVLVIPEAHEAYWKMLYRELGCQIPHKIAYGGATRYHSVKNGLAMIGDSELIAVHDGVRPFVAHEVITACFDAAATSGAAIPVVSMIDSVREISGSGSRPFDRERLCIVQTPQVFRADILRKAYEHPYNEKFTDDASLVESVGHTISLVEGNRENIKITTPMDLKYAEWLCGLYINN